MTCMVHGYLPVVELNLTWCTPNLVYVRKTQHTQGKFFVYWQHFSDPLSKLIEETQKCNPVIKTSRDHLNLKHLILSFLIIKIT